MIKDKDVECLFLLVEAMGNHFWKEYRVKICLKSTVGSIAEHIWQHTLPKNIPKLLTETRHKLWQQANRGGWCGPLGKFDTTTLPCGPLPKHDTETILGRLLYKVDICSLYPACCRLIQYHTKVVNDKGDEEVGEEREEDAKRPRERDEDRGHWLGDRRRAW